VRGNRALEPMASVSGLDTAMSVFQIHGVNSNGKVNVSFRSSRTVHCNICRRSQCHAKPIDWTFKSLNERTSGQVSLCHNAPKLNLSVFVLSISLCGEKAGTNWRSVRYVSAGLQRVFSNEE